LFWFFQEYLEFGGMGNKLSSMVSAKGTVALTVNWMFELDVWSFFGWQMVVNFRHRGLGCRRMARATFTMKTSEKSEMELLRPFNWQWSHFGA